MKRGGAVGLGRIDVGLLREQRATAALSPFMTASATSLLAALRPATIIKDITKDITVPAMIRFRLIVVLLWGRTLFGPPTALS